MKRDLSLRGKHLSLKNLSLKTGILATAVLAASSFLPASANASVIYWDGGSAVNGNFVDTANWSTAGTTGTNTDTVGAVPGSGDDVVFYRSGAARLTGAGNATPSAAITFQSLTFGNGQTGAVTIAATGGNAITLNGKANFDPSVVTSGASTNLGTVGLFIQSGTGAVTISAPVTVGTNTQTWINNSNNAVTLGGAIVYGGKSLTLQGGTWNINADPAVPQTANSKLVINPNTLVVVSGFSRLPRDGQAATSDIIIAGGTLRITGGGGDPTGGDNHHIDVLSNVGTLDLGAGTLTINNGRTTNQDQLRSNSDGTMVVVNGTMNVQTNGTDSGYLGAFSGTITASTGGTINSPDTGTDPGFPFAAGVQVTGGGTFNQGTTNLFPITTTLKFGGITGLANNEGKGGTFNTGNVSQTFAKIELNNGASTLASTAATGNLAFGGAAGSVTRGVPGGLLNITSTNLNIAFSVAPTGGAVVGATNPIISGVVRNGLEFFAATTTPYTVTYTTANSGATFLNNADVTTSFTTDPSPTVNGVRFNTAGATTLTISGTATVSSGMFLVTNTVGNNATVITGGTITSGNGQDVTVANYNTNANGTIQIDSVIADAAPATPTGLTYYATTRALTITAANTHKGPTSVLANVLTVANNNGLQNSTLDYNNQGGSISFSAGTTAPVLGGIAGAQNFAVTGTVTSLTVGNSNTVGLAKYLNPTYSGALSGGTNMSLTKVGTNTQTLSGANTYSGATIINGGKLALGATGTINNSSSISIAPAATFDVSAVSNYALAQTLNAKGAGTANVTGTVNATNRTIDLQDGTNIGTLAVSGGLTSAAGTFKFDLGSATNDLLSIGGAGAASGTLTISALPLTAATSLNTTPNFYTIISAASGTLNGATYQLSSSLVTAGSNSYLMSVSSTATAVTLTATAVTSSSWKGVDNLFSNAANWTGAVPGAGTIAQFDGTDTLTSGTTIVDINTGAQTSLGVTFTDNIGNSTNASAYTIGNAGPGGGNALTIANGGVVSITANVVNAQLINAPLVIGTGSAAFTNNASNTSATMTLAGGVSGGSAVPTTLTLGGSSAAENVVSGNITTGSATSLAVNVSGGIWSLAGNNNFAGGVTLNSGARLNVNSSTALGATAGTFVINGGTIGNTSGVPQTNANNNPQTWAGDFTFAGANNLDLGTGAVSMPSSRQVTVSANTLAVGGNIAGGTNVLTKAGAGKLSLAGTNTYGSTVINGGTLAVNGDGALGTVPGAAATNITFTGNATLQANTATLSLSANRNIVVNTGVSGAFDTNGNSIVVNGAISGAGGIIKTGGGTMTLVKSDSYNGATVITTGTLKLGTTSGVGVATPTALLAANVNINANTITAATTTSVANLGSGGGTLTSSAATPVTATSINGHPAFTFNNNTSQAFYSSTAYSNTGNQMTVIMVEKTTTLPGGGFKGEFGMMTYPNGSQSDWQSTAHLAVDNGDAGSVNNIRVTRNTATQVSMARPNAGPFIWDVTYDGATTSGNTQVLGSAVTNFTGSASSGNFNISSLALGSRLANSTPTPNLVAPFQGDVGQMLVFNTALTASERNDVRTYLAAYWATNPTYIPAASALQVASGATLDMNGYYQQVASLSDSGGSGGVVTNTAAGTVSTLLVGTSGTATFNGVIQDGGGTAKLALTMNGSGTQILGGTNTYTGPTLVQTGTLALSATGSISNTSVLGIGLGGTFSLGSNHSESIAAVSLIDGTISGSGTSALTSGSAFDVRKGSVSAILAGGVGLSKTTSSAVTLTGDNTYNGITSIASGKLALVSATSNNNIGTSSKILVGAGANLDVTGITAGGGFIIPSTQTLAGFGTVIGNTTVQGSLAPGNSIGTLSITGDLALSGTSDFEITGNASSNTYDKTIATGAIAYGGTLNVAYLTTTPSDAGTYKLFTFASQSGDFSAVSLPAAPSGMHWRDYGSSDFFNNATGEVQLELDITAGNIDLIPNSGTGRTISDTVVIANTANLSATDSLTVSITGNGITTPGTSNGTFNQTGITNGAVIIKNTSLSSGALTVSGTANKLNGAKIAGTLNFSVAGTTIPATGEGPTGTYALAGAVSGNTVAVIGNGTTFGTAQTAIVVSGDTLAGLSTSLSDSSGSTLTLVDSTALTGDTTVTVKWRERSNLEAYPGSTPPLPANISSLITDVAQVDLGVNAPSVYVVQMSYNPAALGGISETDSFLADHLYLAHMIEGADLDNGSNDDNWQHAGTDPLNPANLRAYTASDLAVPGSWGVDSVAHVAWAVMPSSVQGQFAVVPEPASLSLLAIGALGLLTRRRR